MCGYTTSGSQGFANFVVFGHDPTDCPRSVKGVECNLRVVDHDYHKVGSRYLEQLGDKDSHLWPLQWVASCP